MRRQLTRAGAATSRLARCRQQAAFFRGVIRFKKLILAETVGAHAAATMKRRWDAYELGLKSNNVFGVILRDRLIQRIFAADVGVRIPFDALFEGGTHNVRSISRGRDEIDVRHRNYKFRFSGGFSELNNLFSAAFIQPRISYVHKEIDRLISSTPSYDFDNRMTPTHAVRTAEDRPPDGTFRFRGVYTRLRGQRDRTAYKRQGRA